VLRGAAQAKFQPTQADAANLCAGVFTNSRSDVRFSMSMHDLGTALRLDAHVVDMTLSLADERGWVRVVGNSVKLTAAGIYVAKETLALPR
jgi:hypothetical protein